MAGQQSQQITVGLYPDLVHLVGLDDGDLRHGVGQLLPQVGHSHLIAHLQQVNMPEVVRVCRRKGKGVQASELASAAIF